MTKVWNDRLWNEKQIRSDNEVGIKRSEQV